MNDNLLIETKEIGDYRIKIYYDDCNECPVTNWDMGGNYLLESLDHGGYHICRDCDWKEWLSDLSYRTSMQELLVRMASDAVGFKNIVQYIKDGNVDNLRLVYNRQSHLWELQYFPVWKGKSAEWTVDMEIEPYDLKNDDYSYEFLDSWDEDEIVELIKKYAKDFVIRQFSSCGYSQGDHLRGIAYMSKERFDKMCGFNPNKYKDWKEQAMTVIEEEIKCIEMWAWGDVKGYVLEKKVPFTKTYTDGTVEEDFEWEEEFSCWGFYMETEDLIAEVISDHGLKEVA